MIYLSRLLGQQSQAGLRYRAPHHDAQQPRLLFSCALYLSSNAAGQAKSNAGRSHALSRPGFKVANQSPLAASWDVTDPEQAFSEALALHDGKRQLLKVVTFQ